MTKTWRIYLAVPDSSFLLPILSISDVLCRRSYIMYMRTAPWSARAASKRERRSILLCLLAILVISWLLSMRNRWDFQWISWSVLLMRIKYFMISLPQVLMTGRGISSWLLPRLWTSWFPATWKGWSSVLQERIRLFVQNWWKNCQREESTPSLPRWKLDFLISMVITVQKRKQAKPFTRYLKRIIMWLIRIQLWLLAYIRNIRLIQRMTHLLWSHLQPARISLPEVLWKP